MNDDEALREVREYLTRLENLQGIRQVLGADQAGMNPTYKEIDQLVRGQTAMIEKVARKVDDRLVHGLRQDAPYPFWRHKNRFEAAVELVAVLEGREREEQIFGVAGPRLAASKMHPWVWGAASQLWDDGHIPQAIATAASAIFDIYLPAALGVARGTVPPEKMIRDAFDETTPALTIAGFDQGTQDWNNAYQGARNLGLACVRLVRNLRTHNVNRPSPEEVALEELAMLSRFARLIDGATTTASASPSPAPHS